MSEPKKPKKRGRKSKKEKEALLKAQQEGLIDIPVKKNKKRGRKPKGGKIIQAKNLNTTKADKTNPNIILQIALKISKYFSETTCHENFLKA